LAPGRGTVRAIFGAGPQILYLPLKICSMRTRLSKKETAMRKTETRRMNQGHVTSRQGRKKGHLNILRTYETARLPTDIVNSETATPVS
jgi:hypothetical protein